MLETVSFKKIRPKGLTVTHLADKQWGMGFDSSRGQNETLDSNFLN